MMTLETKKSMSVIKHHNKLDCVNNGSSIINDHRLTWKAKGLMMYLLNRPDGYRFAENEIIASSKDGREATANGLAELEKYGYLVRSPIRSENGQFCGRQWDVNEIPINQKEIY